MKHTGKANGKENLTNIKIEFQKEITRKTAKVTNIQENE